MWYEIVLKADDNDTWLVTAPAFPEMATFGQTRDDAYGHARAAIEEAIAARIARNEDVPEPMADRAGHGWFIEIPALVVLKSALHMILRAKGWTRADLMRALDRKREHVDRLFRLDHNSRLDSLEDAFKALGEPLRFDVPFPHAA